MGRLLDWWRRVRGHETVRRAPDHDRREAPKPAAHGELGLMDDVQPKRPSRVGAAGFDPYSSDAGYSKPHSWERVDHD
jgi:hypothetical protein